MGQQNVQAEEVYREAIRILITSMRNRMRGVHAQWLFQACAIMPKVCGDHYEHAL